MVKIKNGKIKNGKKNKNDIKIKIKINTSKLF